MDASRVSRRQFVAGVGFVATSGSGIARSFANFDASPFHLLVMDPLAAPLSCPCVKGYAQRDYDALGKQLESVLGRPVKVYFGESLPILLAKKSGGKADLIIGKESVVRLESKQAGLKASPIASLTGKDGSTTMTGWVVVSSSDPALSIADLGSHKILFGPPECDEKYKTAIELFEEIGIQTGKPVSCHSCSDGATKILDMAKKGEKGATVISSYAAPLLEGCGTIQKGDLKVIGKTEPVPFVVAFVNDQLPPETQKLISAQLVSLKNHPALIKALETKEGFVPFVAVKKN